MLGDQLFHVVQPIINNHSNEILGYEVLLRTKNKQSPDQLFKIARENGELVNLDIHSIHSFLTNNPIPNDKKIFLNIFPSSLLSDKFLDLLMFIKSLNNKNLVFEINETNEESEIWGMKEFIKKINLLKETGISIAIDDVGKGQSTLLNLVNLQPNFIKMDKFFSEGLSTSFQKQKIVAAFVELAKSFNALLVLEGMETKKDLNASKKLNIPYIQGFYFGMPRKYEHFSENQTIIK